MISLGLSDRLQNVFDLINEAHRNVQLLPLIIINLLDGSDILNPIRFERLNELFNILRFLVYLGGHVYEEIPRTRLVRD